MNKLNYVFLDAVIFDWNQLCDDYPAAILVANWFYNLFLEVTDEK